MKTVQPDLTLLVSGGAQQKSNQKSDGLLDPKKILFPQETKGDFFSKWISYR